MRNTSTVPVLVAAAVHGTGTAVHSCTGTVHSSHPVTRTSCMDGPTRQASAHGATRVTRSETFDLVPHTTIFTCEKYDGTCTGTVLSLLVRVVATVQLYSIYKGVPYDCTIYSTVPYCAAVPVHSTIKGSKGLYSVLTIQLCDHLKGLALLCGDVYC
jgi:hypothetical protein